MTRLGTVPPVASGSLWPGAFHAAIVAGNLETSVRTPVEPLMV
jgi:hypothetical protein